MTIHFTPDGIFADTEEEKLAFYDRMHAGDPVIMANIEVWRARVERDKRGGDAEQGNNN